MIKTVLLIAGAITIISSDDSFIDHENKIRCEEEYVPENCDHPSPSLMKMNTVEDFERCAPGVLPILLRNYFWGGAGRKVTYENNRKAFAKISILPRILYDVSQYTLQTKILGRTVDLPVGISPTAFQSTAHSHGEVGTAIAAAAMGAIMVISSWAQVPIEEIVNAGRSERNDFHFWLQTYIYKDREITKEVIRKAEQLNAEAVLVTLDSPVYANFSCTAKSKIAEFVGNLNNSNMPDPAATLQDIVWLVQQTRLPIVAKGILRVEDALRVARAGVSAILVSNHGGREMDSAPATIDVLPGIADALKYRFPHVELYLDSGVRNGWDVFKVFGMGGRAAFIGRPAIWGLTIGGTAGVTKVLDILRREFEETMRIAGYKRPTEIDRNSVGRLEYGNCGSNGRRGYDHGGNTQRNMQ